ncbi:keratin, type I cytoskeletal 14-like [Sinocyclocheilus grahami]|uniref:keratin, type I cytoskeletal 14-like n=1 Tax=Sinocyclocheilus grahami TaxID=75366 RepID=UPI0007ACE322|nr:PREDICTED: keratin, type I cytoskeletal 14-like [Sinocyclocheilus grahami]
MLAGYQNQINMLEAELCQMRASIEQQGRDYALLLDIKTRLEQEIATYRSLLENQDIKTQIPGSTIMISGGSLSSGGSHMVTSGGSQSSGGSHTITTGGPAIQIKQTTTTSHRTY